jgi:hypothetical protein
MSGKTTREWVPQISSTREYGATVGSVIAFECCSVLVYLSLAVELGWNHVGKPHAPGHGVVFYFIGVAG